MKQIKKYTFVIFFFSYCICDSFGNNEIEITNDTILLNDYCLLAIKNSEINRDSAIYYSNLALEIAEKLNQKFYQASILSDLGYILLSSGDYSNALTKLLIANKLIEDKNIAKDVIITPFFSQYFTSEDPKSNRIILMGYIKNSLAMLYGRTDNFDKQLSVLQEAKQIIETETDDLNLRYIINNNIANAYLNKGNLDSALVFQNIVLDIERKIEHKNYSGASNKAIGDIYFRKGNFEDAKINYLKGLTLMKNGNNNFYLALSQFALAETYRKLGKVDSTSYYAKEGIKNYRMLGSSVPEMEEAYTALALSFRELNKYDSAYYYLQLAKNISDSLKDKEIKTLTAFQNIGFNEQMKLKEIEAEKNKIKNRNKILLLLIGLFLFSMLAFVLHRSNKRKIKTNLLLAEQKRQIENTLVELKVTQNQLIQKEKLASLGELTAGIAHEIQNPLNFVNNFSELSVDLVKDLQHELKRPDKDETYIDELFDDLSQNQEKINHHGKRASNIVKGMLEHSRTSTGVKEPTDINKLVDESLRLSYHAMRAKDKSFNADFTMDLDEAIGKVNIIPQDMGRVLINLFNNAFYAVNQRKQLSNDENYTPSVSVTTKQLEKTIEIRVKDNGSGIPDNIKQKIFQPFFTTKPTGEGTGLGLSLSYDIVVKGHAGTLEVTSTNGEGSTFIIQLPIQIKE